MADHGTVSAPDVDRKGLRGLIGRFRARDSVRRARIRESLSVSQRHLMDALPVVLHTNHAAMPGFIDFDVPAGIDGYSPDGDAVAAARKLALSFTFERFKVRKTAIQSLILEPRSARAFTVWVIALRSHHESLGDKLTAIARHAALMELELTFKLVDALDARSGHAAALGVTPKLTLDGIYRAGIVLAGRFPIWWLVPPSIGSDYVAYCERLRQQRFVSGKDTIDLGATHRIPQKECFIAGTHALTAAFDAPLSLLPRLTLIDSYLDGFGTTLADRLKVRMQSANTDGAATAADDTDLLDQLEGYLAARNEPDRLDLIRVAALEIGLPGARTRAADSWGFSAARLHHLDDRRAWSFGQWRKEDLRVTSALRITLAKLRATAADNGFDTALLDPLAAILNRPPVDSSINAALLPARWAPALILERLPDGWQMRDSEGPILTAPRLVGIAIWAHRHRLDPFNLAVEDVGHRRRFVDILAAIAKNTPSAGGALLLVNAEEHPTGMHTGAERTVVSSFDDALDFSGFRANLVEAIDYVEQGEGVLRTTHYPGSPGLTAAFARALADSRAAHRCVCIDTERQHAIESRVIDLIQQGQSALARSKKFAHAVGARIAVYTRYQGGVAHRLYDEHAALLDREGARPDAIVFDERNDRLPVQLLVARQPPEHGAHAPR